MDKEKYTVVSFSGGKDSTAMLLKMLELGEPIDEVVCCDTYKEFP
jgi:tRNA(Ile)-lysidine synthase TilS/MesJ